MDELTKQFLELVDCAPEEVRDVQDAIRQYTSANVKVRDGSQVIHFGKHNGKSFDAIPEGYLRWLVRQPQLRSVKRSTMKSIEKTKERVRRFLNRSFEK